MVSKVIQNRPGPLFSEDGEATKLKGRGKGGNVKNSGFRGLAGLLESHNFAPIHDERKNPGIPV